MVRSTTIAPEHAPVDADAQPLPARVLVADDETLVAQHLTDALRELGLQVVGPFSNGFSAIEAARAEKPDLALIDIRMPRLDGLETAQVLQGTLGVPVVLVSAFSDEDYIRTGAEIGVFGYLIKPVHTEGLRATLAVAWARFRDESGLRDRVATLERTLEERKIVERAKGILMDSLGLGESEAMRLLQKHARDNRIRLAKLAGDIVEGRTILSPRRP